MEQIIHLFFGGGIYGVLMVCDRFFCKIEEKVFEPVRWFITFCTVNVLWLLFRAESVGQWKTIIKTILMMQNTTISDGLIDCFTLQEIPFLVNILHLEKFSAVRGFWLFVYVIFAMGICLLPENNYKTRNKLSAGMLFAASIAFVWGFICLSSESVFVYFNF